MRYRNKSYKRSFAILYLIQRKNCGVDYFEKNPKNEQFIERFYRNTVCNSKKRFGVDYQLYENMSNE